MVVVLRVWPGAPLPSGPFPLLAPCPCPFLVVDVVVDGVAAIVVVVVVDLGPLPGLAAAVVVVVAVDGEVVAGLSGAVAGVLDAGVVDVIGGTAFGTVVGDEVGRCPAVVVEVALEALAEAASDTPASVSVRLA